MPKAGKGGLTLSTRTHHWFEPLADHMGAAYLRYAFTKGTAQEAAFLCEALGLQPGMRVLDVGCGPGRHAYALALAGLHVVGVDISQRFVDLARAGAPPGASFVRGDACALPVRPLSFDVALSLCQGGFGLLGGPGGAGPGVRDADGDVLAQMAAAVRPGGRVVVSAFSAYFQVRFLEEHDRFDAATGVNHERTEVRSESGEVRDADLWTTCFTPRELRLLAERAGLQVDDIWSVTPGRYAAQPPEIGLPEFLLVARRPERAGNRAS